VYRVNLYIMGEFVYWVIIGWFGILIILFIGKFCLFKSCVYSKVVFIQKFCLFKSCVYSKVVFIQKLCLFKSCVYSKVLFIQKLCLFKSFVYWQVCTLGELGHLYIGQVCKLPGVCAYIVLVICKIWKCLTCFVRNSQ
jgi:hypothetical protein